MGNVCKHNVYPPVPTQTWWQYKNTWRTSLPIQILLTTLLTDMRFKNNIWASGTPFCMSNSMAWLAELPSWESARNIQPFEYYKTANNQLNPNKWQK